MSIKRERSFTCSFSSPRRNVSGHVRAWSASDATEAFLREISDSGAVEDGTVDVRDERGRSYRARVPVGGRAIHAAMAVPALALE